jgi:hypothetical protein
MRFNYFDGFSQCDYGRDNNRYKMDRDSGNTFVHTEALVQAPRLALAGCVHNPNVSHWPVVMLFLAMELVKV